MILNMATDMNSRTNTRRTPLHFSIPQHHSCQFAYSDIFDVGEHTSVAPTHYLFTADISFLPVSRLGCDIGSTAGGGHGEPSGKQTVHCMCVCVCVGLELHNDTDLLPHCCILVHGRTHTHTQWVWLLRGVPCTDRHTSDKLRPGLTQVEENI